MGEQPKHGMQEIDLATGQFKKINPLKSATDYRKWDQIANRVTEHNGGEDEVAEYFWVGMPHTDIRVRIPILGKTISKQCKVIFRRNWLTVYAPSPECVVGSYPPDKPNKEPLLDFQLYGAVDVDECHWELVDDAVQLEVLSLIHI